MHTHVYLMSRIRLDKSEMKTATTFCLEYRFNNLSADKVNILTRQTLIIPKRIFRTGKHIEATRVYIQQRESSLEDK